jgi:hypothetical protein
MGGEHESELVSYLEHALVLAWIAAYARPTKAIVRVHGLSCEWCFSCFGFLHSCRPIRFSTISRHHVSRLTSR